MTEPRGQIGVSGGASVVWPCPGCGRPVTISLEPAEDGTIPEGASPGSRDRLAQALCGCYVLDMPEDSLRRLLGAILSS